MDSTPQKRLPFIAAVSLGLSLLSSPALTQVTQGAPTPTFEEIKRKAESGDLNSELRLANMYLSGNGVLKDVSQAELWFRKISGEGANPGFFPGSASNNLGNIYLEKYKQNKDQSDLNKALDWYSKALDQGYDSATLVSRWYQNGTNGFPKDLSQAMFWLGKCVKANHQPSANMARISLAKIYLSGEGTSKDTSKARSLLEEVLNSKDETGKGEASNLLAGIDGYQTIGALSGDLNKDNPTFPSFYMWRRVYQKSGMSDFKQCLINPSGKLTPLAMTVGPSYDESWKNYLSTLEAKNKTNKDLAITLTSPSENWQVIEGPGEDSFHSAQLTLKSKSETEPQTITIPIYEWRGLIGWNPKMDLFYYWTSGGADTGRESMYYQLDPAKKVFTLIGLGGGQLNFSQNGKWIIWFDGDGMDYSDRQLVAYSVETNKNYVLTSGHSDNRFDNWVDDPSIAEWDEMKAQAKIHIEGGKKYFFAQDYDNAIGEYQKAIGVDPKNSEAYDLMGYSYFREGKLDEARKALNTSASLDPHNLMSYYNLALVVWAQNQPYQAVLYLKVYINGDKKHKRLIEEDPQFKELIQSDEYKKLILHQK